ncbi:SAM-dependent methyltransferase [Desulfosarcina ovata subsp. sediminis]|uniref:SAM-dependent methyltransferase n=1 Tax=Desulfosarcina ovata subsp. sediminis TaxID=885957 RepID=A0A5K7ZQ16_9BACT|nr:class I SAM-dependent methyltransferase [Desulfosarcina ovata]BBO82109.1 SAM-dependent methyltransferase [Desulfosarcina ovata subsp. sediminis]
MERLATVVPPIEDRSKYLRELAGGFEKGQIFLTALELDLFTLLETPRSVQEVAETLETLPHITNRFLDVLVGLHLLTPTDGKYETASDVAPFLVKDAPYAARYLNFATQSRKTWMQLAETMKTGPTEKATSHDHVYDQPCIDWMARGTLLGRLQGTVKHLQEFPEFHAAKKLVDLGGGHGLFGIAFAQENPDLEVVIFDKPDVTPMTQGYIDRYNMQARVTTMAGDYTRDDIGAGYDIAFEACSFGGRGDEALAFYRQVAAALKDNGLFFRLTFTLDDDRSGPLNPLIWDLKEQLTGHSHMHMKTTTELFTTLADAGFQQERTIDMTPWSNMETRLIVARKALGS